MITLTKSLLPFLELCSKDSGRYSMNGVRIAEFANNEFRLEVTDGKYLGVIQSVAEPDRIKALADRPDVGLEYLVAVDDVRGLLKSTDSRHPHAGIVQSGPNDVWLGTEGGATRITQVMDGRFPPVASLFEDRGAIAAVTIDAKRLCTLLKAAACVADGEDGIACVTLMILDRKGKLPLGVMSRSAKGVFDGLLMPISTE